MPSSACARSSDDARCVGMATGYAAVGDRVGARARGLDRHGQRGAAGALHVEADGHARRLAQPRDEIADARRRRASRPGRAAARGRRRAPAGPRALDQEVVAARPVGVDEAGVAGGRPPRARRRPRPARSSASLSGSCRRKMSMPDSAAQRMKRRTRSGAAGCDDDEERAAQRHRERRAGRALLDRADALPGALDAARDRGAEAAAAGDLERVVARARRARSATSSRPRGGHAALERLLGQQAEGGVDQPGHGAAARLRASDVAALARVDPDAVADVHEERHRTRWRRSRARAGLVTFETVSPFTPGSVSHDLELDRRRAAAWWPACRRRDSSWTVSPSLTYRSSSSTDRRAAGALARTSRCSSARRRRRRRTGTACRRPT